MTTAVCFVCGHKLHAVMGRIPRHDTEGRKLPTRGNTPVRMDKIGDRRRARIARAVPEDQRPECRGGAG